MWPALSLCDWGAEAGGRAMPSFVRKGTIGAEMLLVSKEAKTTRICLFVRQGGRGGAAVNAGTVCVRRSGAGPGAEGKPVSQLGTSLLRRAAPLSIRFKMSRSIGCTRPSGKTVR